MLQNGVRHSTRIHRAHAPERARDLVVISYRAHRHNRLACRRTQHTAPQHKRREGGPTGLGSGAQLTLDLAGSRQRGQTLPDIPLVTAAHGSKARTLSAGDAQCSSSDDASSNDTPDALRASSASWFCSERGQPVCATQDGGRTVLDGGTKYAGRPLSASHVGSACPSVAGRQRAAHGRQGQGRTARGAHNQLGRVLAGQQHARLLRRSPRAHAHGHAVVAQLQTRCRKRTRPGRPQRKPSRRQRHRHHVVRAADGRTACLYCVSHTHTHTHGYKRPAHRCM
jgi:hypothetical protein